MQRPCQAPVFEGSSGLTCFFNAIRSIFVLTVLVILLILTFGNPGILCLIRRVVFRMRHCLEGNPFSEINLTGDLYERHVSIFRNRFRKSGEWELWMLANRSRYQAAFEKASAAPSPLEIAFRYEREPIAYDPPWSNETEHMAALKSVAESTFGGLDFRFLFEGDTVSSYANVIAGTSDMTSHASGKDIFLYYETIFNHEFAHVTYLPHHYDTEAEYGTGRHMPPGDSRCLMDRNSNQFCSACKTALRIPLDFGNEEATDAAVREILRRYPY